MGPAGGAARAGRFFGVYLLYCLNPRHRGRVYVGFTVNPARREQQHNAGRKKGGAWRTSGRGPWEMVLIVHGFPSAVAALRFEWAWQHPKASRRLAHLGPRLRGEAAFAFHLRVLAHMLRVPPWARLPLTLRWLRTDFRQDLCPPPPPHVPLAFGPPPPRALARKCGAVPLASMESESQPQHAAEALCTVCACALQDEEGPLCCPHPGCSLRAHVICLAEEFLHEEPGQLLPLEGQCPGCKNSVLWGDLVWLSQMGTEEEEDLELEEEHWTDMLET